MRGRARAGAEVAIGCALSVSGTLVWALSYVPAAVVLVPCSLVAAMVGVAFWDDHSCGRCAPPVVPGGVLVADRFRWWSVWNGSWTAVAAAVAAAVVLVVATVTGFVPYHQGPTVALASWAWVAGTGGAMAAGHEWACGRPAPL